LSCRLYTPAVASFRRAAGPAGLGGPGGADRVERVGFALAEAVLPVGPVDLDDPDAMRLPPGLPEGRAADQ